MFHALTTCPKWFDELSELPHATTGNPEDSDPKAADHLADLTRYFLLNIDGGPQFTVFPDEEPNAVAAAITPLEPVGAFGYQRSPDEPQWLSGDDDAPRRTVRTAE
jgi:hypothetical protein